MHTIRLYAYVTRPGKTGLMCTSTVFHFLSVRESYTHALPRNTKYLTIDGQVYFHRRLFTDAVKPRGCISQHLRGINRTAWDTKLLLTALLAHPVDCTSSGPILKAQHCCLSPNGCFTPPSASHPPLPPPSPARPPPRDSIRDITGSEKSYLKNQQYCNSW